MTDLELLPFIIRDLKWRSACLDFLVDAVIQGKDIDEWLNKGTEKKWQEWLEAIDATR